MTDPVEQHRLRRTGAGEPAGEHLAVVGEDLLRHPVPANACRSAVTHRPRRRPGHQPRAHHEPGMVIDAGDHLHLDSVGRWTPPITSICHSSIARPPLPPPVVRAPAAALARVRSAVADQRPIHRRPRRHRGDAPSPRPAGTRSGPDPSPGAQTATPTPAPPPPPASDADTTAAGTDDRPDSRSHPQRHTGATTRAPSAGPPRTGGPPPSPAPVQDLQHRPIPLLHHRQLHQHRRPLPRSTRPRKEPPQAKINEQWCRPATEQMSRRNRTCVPKLSPTYRNPGVQHLPETHKTWQSATTVSGDTRRQPISDGGADEAVDLPGQCGAPPGTRTPNPRIKSPLLCQLS